MACEGIALPNDYPPLGDIDSGETRSRRIAMVRWRYSLFMAYGMSSEKCSSEGLTTPEREDLPVLYSLEMVDVSYFQTLSL